MGRIQVAKTSHLPARLIKTAMSSSDKCPDLLKFYGMNCLNTVQLRLMGSNLVDLNTLHSSPLGDKYANYHI
jgi:hypothetical protein